MVDEEERNYFSESSKFSVTYFPNKDRRLVIYSSFIPRLFNFVGP